MIPVCLCTDESLTIWYSLSELSDKNSVERINMRRWLKPVILLLFFLVTSTGCYTGKKNLSELGGLMLLDNTQLSRNKAYYSKHNRKVKSKVHSKFRKAARNNHKKTYRIYRWRLLRPALSGTRNDLTIVDTIVSGWAMVKHFRYFSRINCQWSQLL